MKMTRNLCENPTDDPLPFCVSRQAVNGGVASGWS